MQSFACFVKIHVSWKVVNYTVTTNDENKKLLIWNEPGPTERIAMVYNKMCQYPNTMKMPMEFSDKVLECCNRIIRGMKQDALDGSRLIFNSCRKDLRDEDPCFFRISYKYSSGFLNT